MLGMLTFAVGGIISGVIIAWSMDYRTLKELAQGGLGGLIAGVVMALLLPM